MISVCVATYNGQKYIKEQIASIINQLSFDDEIIISDNNSNDSTVEILKSFGDPRIKIYVCYTKGIVSNFENSLCKASGDLIFLSDQDDIWIDGKVNSMKDALISSDLVMSDGYVVSETLVKFGSSIYDFTKPKLGFFSTFMRNSYTGCCIAFNRKVLDAAIPFPPSLPMHDWWFGIIAQSVGHVTILQDKLILYRRHGENSSTMTTPSSNSIFIKIFMRIKMFSYFINRRFIQKMMLRFVS